jgi:outer membrane protein assembly factor BamB
VTRASRFVLVGVALGALALPAQAATPAVPIPGDPVDVTVTPYVGKPAAAHPLGRVVVPEHPYMARNGASNIHDDAYQTDVYDGPGPLGRDLRVTSTFYGQECASVTFDSKGRIVTVCPGVTGATLRLIDPTSLAELASYSLPARPPGTFSFTNFSGGGYFYLDRHDRAVVATFTGHLLTIAEDGDAFRLIRDDDLTAHTGGTGIQSALPDWSGRIWFVTVGGRVGVVDSRTRAIRSRQLPGEVIANSFAIDESGGVFVVSDHALYRFDAGRGGAPAITWRQPYDRGSRVKPGQVSQGSGTTPTLIGSASSPGGGSIAITDNADPRMHVVVYRRGRSGPGKPLCNQAVFPPNQGSDENSLIAVPGGLIAENNYGYTGPTPTGPSVRSPDTVPGLVRVDVDYRRGGCRVAWTNTTARVPTLVSKVSLRTGLLYTYTHPAPSELPWAVAPLPTAPESWFLTAFDARTGRQVWSQLVGSGLGYNNNYAPVSLGRDGAAYVGTLGGLVRIADGA